MCADMESSFPLMSTNTLPSSSFSLKFITIYETTSVLTSIDFSVAMQIVSFSGSYGLRLPLGTVGAKERCGE